MMLQILFSFKSICCQDLSVCLWIWISNESEKYYCLSKIFSGPVLGGRSDSSGYHLLRSYRQPLSHFQTRSKMHHKGCWTKFYEWLQSDISLALGHADYKFQFCSNISSSENRLLFLLSLTDLVLLVVLGLRRIPLIFAGSDWTGDTFPFLLFYLIPIEKGIFTFSAFMFLIFIGERFLQTVSFCIYYFFLVFLD